VPWALPICQSLQILKPFSMNVERLPLLDKLVIFRIMSIFVNKVLLEHIHTYSYSLWLLLCYNGTVVYLWQSFLLPYIPQSLDIYYLALSRKCSPVSGLNEEEWSFLVLFVVLSCEKTTDYHKHTNTYTCFHLGGLLLRKQVSRMSRE
jgi:hypothetical protein